MPGPTPTAASGSLTPTFDPPREGVIVLVARTIPIARLQTQRLPRERPEQCESPFPVAEEGRGLARRIGNVRVPWHAPTRSSVKEKRGHWAQLAPQRKHAAHER